MPKAKTLVVVVGFSKFHESIYILLYRKKVEVSSPHYLIPSAPRLQNMSSGRQHQWLHQEGSINGIHIHWVEAGHKDSPLVIMLHGFPEFWYSWRHQIHCLRDKGFRVVAPDLRGYNLSEKPDSGYDSDTLTTDIFELIKYLGQELKGAHIVGHGLGAAIAWAFAAKFPSVTKKLVVLSFPPIPKYIQCLHGWQLICSWYVLFFQLPRIPEYITGCNRGWLLTHGMKMFSKEEDWMDEDLMKLNRESASRPGSLHCMIEYYRNMWSSAKQCELYGKVRAPTLVLFGEHDKAFQPTIYQDLDEFVTNKMTLEILDCGHWMHQEIPEIVNSRLLRFLKNDTEQAR